MTRLAAIALSFLVAPVSGCGTDTPPELTLGATELALVEGERASVAIDAFDADGDALTLTATATAPIVATIDGATLRVEAPWGWSGDAEIVVTAEDVTGRVTDATLGVSARALAWADRTVWAEGEGPEAREHGTVIVDTARRRAILFGGSGYSPYGEILDDAWTIDLDDGTFTPLDYEGELPLGLSRRAAVSAPGVALLFGGADDTGPLDALVRVDFTDEVVRFTPVEQDAPPPPRSLHAFVHDPADDAYYAFGGYGTGLHGDVWRMTLSDGVARWEALELGDGPDPRYGFFYAFDPAARRLVVYSGARGLVSINPGRDLWALELDGDAPRWRLLLEGDAVPPGRRNGTTLFDPERARMYVFGGTADGRTSEDGLFAFDLVPGAEAVVELDREGAPPVRSSGFGWHDPDTDRLFLGFGNTLEAAYQDLAVLAYRALTSR